MEEIDCQAISNRGVKLVTPNNPGVYPIIPSGTTTAEHERLLAMHKAAVKEYKTCLDISNVLTAKICKAVMLIHLKKQAQTFEFDNVMALKMLQHLSE